MRRALDETEVGDNLYRGEWKVLPAYVSLRPNPIQPSESVLKPPLNKSTQVSQQPESSVWLADRGHASACRSHGARARTIARPRPLSISFCQGIENSR